MTESEIVEVSLRSECVERRSCRTRISEKMVRSASPTTIRMEESTRMKLTPGQTATRSMTVMHEHVEMYAAITGDRNPLHFDEGFASKTKFGRLVVQGGLTTGLLHALVAMDMPGPGTVFLSQNWKFTAPVFIGDTITATAEVMSVHASKPVTQLRMTIIRNDGEVVLEGEAWCYTFSASET